MSDVIQDEDDMAISALFTTQMEPALDAELRDRARRVAERHFGAPGQSVDLLPEGAILGTYQIDRVLGVGGQAVVYRARHIRLRSRIVALKVPHGTETHRMLREADAMARLDHPGVVGIVDLDAESDPPYLILEHCVGGSLADRLEVEGKLSEAEVIRITRALCEALAFAHEHEVVHRDLKPENVLFDSSGNPRIADFGLGKIVAEQISLSLSQASHTGISGTPLYMAPEQERPQATVDGRTDLYSLGKLIYQMLSGEPPRTLRPIEQVRGDLTHAWSELVFRLTETSPDRRPNGAKDVLAVLDAWEGSTAPQPALQHTPGANALTPTPLPTSGSASQPGEPAGPTPEWQVKLQAYGDRLMEDPTYGLAFICVAGGVLAMILGSEAGLIPVVGGVILGLNTRDQQHSERAKELALTEKREAIAAGIPPKPPLTARAVGVFALMTLGLSFLIGMGGSIALYLSVRAPFGAEEAAATRLGGEIALIVALFLLVGSIVLTLLRRVLRGKPPVPPERRWVDAQPPSEPESNDAPAA